jgi:hypothetical protein
VRTAYICASLLEDVRGPPLFYLAKEHLLAGAYLNDFPGLPETPLIFEIRFLRDYKALDSPFTLQIL